MKVFPTLRGIFAKEIAIFDYDSASEKFTADPNSLSDCENAWHAAVKAMEYIFDRTISVEPRLLPTLSRLRGAFN